MTTQPAEQLAKSQAAFEAKFPAMNFAMYTPTQYKDNFTESCFCVWQAAEAFARKQALEDAIAICEARINQYNAPVSEGLLSKWQALMVKIEGVGASDCKEKIKELLND